MRIVLDLQACQSPEGRRRGIGRYSLALAKAIAKHSRGHEIIVLLNAAIGQPIEFLRGQFDDLLPQSQIMTWDALAPAAEIDSANGFRRRASERLRIEVLRQLKPDVVHIASLIEGLADDVIASVPTTAQGFANVVTLYDLIPLVHQGTYLADERVRRWYMQKIDHLRRADLLLGISEFSCNEAHQLLDVPLERLVDISGAADDVFKPLDNAEGFRQEMMRRYGLTRPFVMYAGGFDPRKNIDALIRAFALLPADVRNNRQLAIVGGGPQPELMALRATIGQLGLAEHEVIFTGYVPDIDLVKLYNLCELYVFPSLQEGFGLPALEAMSSGAIVIGSNTSSLPEVIGHAEALFDPYRSESIAKKMAHALTDAAFREVLKAHARQQALKFSWDESARRTLDAFEALVERRSTTTSVSRSIPDYTGESIAFLPAPHSRNPAFGAKATAIYADDDCAGFKSAATLSRLMHEEQEFDRVLIELVDNPYCAKTIALATAGPTDVLPSGRTFGSVWHALANDPEGRRLVVALLYRSGGYRALKVAMNAEFSEDVLALNIRLESLSSLGRCQLHGNDVTSQAWGWRDRVHDIVQELDALEESKSADKWDWHHVSMAISSNLLKPNITPQWLVDISNLFVTDAGTGIQRVVRHILDELLAAPPSGYRVEPIYLDDSGVFRYARSYCERRYFAGEQLPPDEPVDFDPSDVYVGLDLAAHLIPGHLELFSGLRNRGIKLYFVVYDLLPILRPDCFRPELLPMFRAWYEAISEVADGVMCISRAVADEFEAWLHQSRPVRDRPLNIGYFHLGADLAPTGADATAVANGSDPRLANFVEAPTVLMVGTIEPRKGHAQALAAFEELWQHGSKLNLLIIGQRGWLSSELIQTLRKHPEQGRKLLWIENADDALLLAAYRQASVLLMASEGEGFGLPLIEAAHHGLPLIVRDLPVFREVTGEAAYYFSGYTSRDLAGALRGWTRLHERGEVPLSGKVRWQTWGESSAQLTRTLIEGNWVHSWLPGPIRRFNAYDYRFSTTVGRLVRCRMETTGGAGLLLSGPGVRIQAGQYQVRISGRRGDSLGHIRVDIVSRGGEQVHAHREFPVSTAPVEGRLAEMDLVLERDADDLMIQVSVDEAADLRIEHVELDNCTALH